MPEVLTVEQAQAAGIGAELDPAVLADAIDEEEAWLARRIGPLTGPRTQVFPYAYLDPQVGTIRLRRPTDAVLVTDAGGDISARVLVLGDGWDVAYLPIGSRFTGPVEVTYTPTDELEVRRALRELVALSLTTASSAGMALETMGSYSYAKAQGTTTRRRHSVLRDLLNRPQASSVRIRSSVPHGAAGLIGR